MADRYDLPKIKPTEQPTIFNHEAGKWGEITGFVAGIAAMPLYLGEAVIKAVKPKRATNISNVGLAVTGISIAGALIGGLQEKAKQEREQIEGRTVKTPGYWNKGILSGMFVSGLLATPLNMTGSLGIGTSMVVTLAGATIGSAMRNSQLERDYNQAMRLQQQEQQRMQQKQHEQQLVIEKLLTQQAAQSVAPVVVKDEAPALENKHEALAHETVLANQAAHSIDAATASKAGMLAASEEHKASL